MQTVEKRHLLPQYIHKPSILLLTNVIPQIILLFLNIFNFWIVKDEMLGSNMPKVWMVLFAQIILLGMGTFAFVYSRLKQAIDIKLCWFFLLSHMAYLVFMAVDLTHIFPWGIEPWVLDSGDVQLQQFMFMMPALFYAGLRIACFETKLSFGSDFGRSVLTAILSPALWYVLTLASAHGFYWGGSWGNAVSLIFFSGATVTCVLAIIRVVVLFYTWFHQRDRVIRLMAIALVTFIGPLAGLALNREIAFPYDFQSPSVYGLAVINGLVLLIPGILRLKNSSWLFFLKCFAYPFTLYFFLVFLPFLPLSLLAMLAMGLGILILLPSLLFLLHTKILFEDFKIISALKGKVTASGVLILGSLALPVLLLAQSCLDRISLHQAINYVYSSDYASRQSFRGDLSKVKKTLIHMKNVKQGNTMPFLTGIYNQIVFDGMVLSDKKIDFMYRLFMGEEMGETVHLRGRGFLRRGFFGRMVSGAPTRNLDRNVQLASASLGDISTQEGVTTSRLRLKMQNKGESREAEYFSQIHVPQGILITGFSLKIGEAMVPARIFEKKTAMWVYHMIRDYERRDPGLLVYRSATKLDLSIFPFAFGETREAEIEFTFPAHYNPTIYINDLAVSLAKETVQGSNEKILLAQGRGDNTIVILPNGRDSPLPYYKREPYLHFILDYSNGTDTLEQSYVKRMSDIALHFGLEVKGKITAANFEIEPLVERLITFRDSNKLYSLIKKRSIPSRGSLDIGRVIKNELIRYHQDISKDGEDTLWKKYPLFIVISNGRNTILDIEDIEFFTPLLPDTNSIYVSNKDNELEKRTLWDSADPLGNDEVVILKLGDAIKILPGILNHTHAGFIEATKLKDPFFVYSPDLDKFVPVLKVEMPQLRDEYIKGLDLMFENYTILRNPSQLSSALPRLVKSSQETGVMIPSTSYIVVEQSAHLKALKLQEKRKLKGSHVMDFQDEFQTPEPAFWVLLGLTLVWMACAQRRIRLRRHYS